MNDTTHTILMNRRMRVFWWPFSLVMGLLGLAYFHQYDVLSGFTGITGDHGDNRFIAYILEHTYLAFRGQRAVLSPQMFYPVEGTLGYSDALFGLAPIYWLARVMGLSVLPASQWTVIATNLLTYGITLGLLRRGLGLGYGASLVGALFFAYNSAKLNQLNHLQLQPLFLISAMAWILVVLFRERETLSSKKVFLLVATFGLLFDLQLYTSVYIGWFFAFQCLLILVVAAFWSEVRREAWAFVTKHKTSLVAAVAITVVALVPFCLIYLPVLKEAGWRGFDEIEGMLPRRWSYVYMGHLNFVWGWLPDAFPKIWGLPLHWEHRIGLGIVVSGFGLLLVAASIVILNRGRQGRTLPLWVTAVIGSKDRRYLTVLAAMTMATILFYVLASRFKGLESPWWVVFHTIPGARSIRAVARFVLVTSLPTTCIMAAILDNHIAQLRESKAAGRRWLGLSALVGLVVFAMVEQIGKTDGFSVGGEWDRIQHFSRSLEPGCEAFYITADGTTSYPVWELQLDAMLISALTGVPTLNGYSGQSPKGWELWEVRDPAYFSRVQSWMRDKGIEGKKVCKVAIDR